MKRGKTLTVDPARAAERRERREARRASEPPRPEDIAREARRKGREMARSAQPPLKSSAAPTATRRKPLSTASPQQRAAVANRACVVCREQPADPAHLLPLGMCPDGDGDPRAVIPLCRVHHRAYDTGGLDLLPYLEPHARTELAYAVERFGLISTLRRVTNERVYPREGQ